MRSQCIQAVQQAIGRSLTPAETQKIESRIFKARKRLALQDPVAYRALTPAQQVTEAGKIVANEIKAEAARNKLIVARKIIAMDSATRKIDANVLKRGKNNALEAVNDFFEEVYAKAHQIKLRTHGELAPAYEVFGAKWLGTVDGNKRMFNVIKELYGINTGDKASKDFANAWSKIAEANRQRFNALGGNIGKLSDWVIPHSHSTWNVAKAGQDNWINFITPLLDGKRYINEDGTYFDDAQMHDFLSHAYDTISTKGDSKLKPGGSNGYGMKANAHSAERQIHFKDADTYLAYHNQFGGNTLFGTMISHIDKMSRDIAMLEEMGANPNHTAKILMDKYMLKEEQSGNYVDHARNHREFSERVFNQLAGITPPTGNIHFANASRVLLNLERVLLGASGISTAGDLITQINTAEHNNLSGFGVVLRGLEQMTSPEKRRFSRRLGLGLSALTNDIGRYGQEMQAVGWSAKFGNAVYRLSGSVFLTDAGRQAFGRSFLDAVNYVAKKYNSLADIKTSDARYLTKYHVTDKDFEIWKAAKPEIDKSVFGDHEILTYDAVMNTQGYSQAELKSAADKLNEMMFSEVDNAVIEPSLRDRAIMQKNGEGTVRGELERHFMLFKSFPMAFINRQLRRLRDDYETKGSASMAGVKLFALSMIIGGALAQLKTLDRGENPLKMSDPRFYLEALLQSGGLGIYGDFLRKQVGTGDAELLSSLQGPTFALLDSLSNLGRSTIVESATGKDKDIAAKALRLVDRFNPLSTLWFTKAAWKHYALQQMQESLNPGYLRRLRNRAQKEGRDFYMEPGGEVKEPDLMRAFK